MGIRERLSGNEAVAIAMKQINPDVVAAFPITPSTEIPQYFSTFVSNGVVDTEFVAVESEHSAMTACIGARSSRVAKQICDILSFTFILACEFIYCLVVLLYGICNKHARTIEVLCNQSLRSLRTEVTEEYNQSVYTRQTEQQKLLEYESAKQAIIYITTTISRFSKSDKGYDVFIIADF